MSIYKRQLDFLPFLYKLEHKSIMHKTKNDAVGYSHVQTKFPAQPTCTTPIYLQLLIILKILRYLLIN